MVHLVAFPIQETRQNTQEVSIAARQTVDPDLIKKDVYLLCDDLGWLFSGYVGLYK